MGTLISICQSKGGAGKTTLAQILVGVAKDFGYRVGVIDGDVNKSLTTWLEKFSDYSDVECHHIMDEAEMLPKAEELDGKYDVVVVDTAGARTQATMYAIGVSDLVLIPVQISNANIIEGWNTYRTVQNTSKLVNREITARIVLMNYSPNTNISEHVKDEVEALELPIMKTSLHRLVAFQEMSFGKVPKIGTAGAQAQLLVQEIQDMGVLPLLEKIS